MGEIMNSPKGMKSSVPERVIVAMIHTNQPCKRQHRFVNWTVYSDSMLDPQLTPYAMVNWRT